MEKLNLSLQKQVEEKLSTADPGSIFFPTDFRGIGTEDGIKKALSRAVGKGVVKRLAHGIYYTPKVDPVLGELMPSAEKIAQMVAARDGAEIKPTGVAALNQLGLSTQVPTKVNYLTNGSAKQITVGKQSIKLTRANQKVFAMKGTYSKLLLPALSGMDLENLDTEMIMKIRKILVHEDEQDLAHDLKLAPAHVNDFIVKQMKEKEIRLREESTSSVLVPLTKP